MTATQKLTTSDGGDSFMFRKNIPNIITLMNLSFGVLAIMIASSTDKIHLHQRGERHQPDLFQLSVCHRGGSV
jgi:hypothetical protein